MNHRRHYRFHLYIGLLALLVLTGCTTDPGSKYRPGQALRTLFAAQVINPDAPEDPSPVDGISGYISEGIYSERYLKTIMEDPDDDEEQQ